MSDWCAQEATNETIFREMNEWTKDSNDESSVATLMDAYLCECSDRACTEPINLTRQEYEDVRAVSIRFAIALNHENPETDRVVRESPRYATVEKFLPPGAKIARDTDPRR